MIFIKKQYQKTTYYLGKNDSSNAFIINISYSLKSNTLLFCLANNDFVYKKSIDLREAIINKGVVSFLNNSFDNTHIKYIDELLDINIVFSSNNKLFNPYSKIDENILSINGYGRVLNGKITYKNDIYDLLDYKIIRFSQYGREIANNYILNYGYNFEKFDGFYFLKISNFEHSTASILFLYEIHGKVKKTQGKAKIKYHFYDNDLLSYRLKQENINIIFSFENSLINEFKIPEISQGVSNISSCVSINNNISIKIRDDLHNKVLDTVSKTAINERIMYL